MRDGGDVRNGLDLQTHRLNSPDRIFAAGSRSLDEEIHFLDASPALSEFDAGNLDEATIPSEEWDRIHSDPAYADMIRPVYTIGTEWYGFNTQTQVDTAPYLKDSSQIAADDTRDDRPTGPSLSFGPYPYSETPMTTDRDWVSRTIRRQGSGKVPFNASFSPPAHKGQ